MRVGCYRVAGCHAEWSLQLDAVLAATLRGYVGTPTGPRHGSILREDIGIEAVLGRHHEAAQHLQDALRDSVREQLSLALGRRKGRPLDLESLQRLPAAELSQACRQGRLPPSDDPHVMAAALHSLLHPPQLDAVAAAAGPPAAWDQHTPLRQASWLRPVALGVPAAVGSAQPQAAGSAPAQAVPRPGSRVDDVSSAGAAVAAAAATEVEADADAALLAEAEREAAALFDSELQRRLQQAAAAAAARPAAGAQSAVEVSQLRGQQQQQQHGQDGRRQVPATGGRTSLFMSTTELLAASEPAVDSTGGPPARGGGGGGDASGGGSEPSYGGGSEPSYGGGSLFHPLPPWTGPPQPAEVVRAVRRCLVRLGYGFKDPAQLRSLLLVSRAELLRLVRDFSGSDSDGAGQSREQLAVRLLQMMAGPPVPGDGARVDGGAVIARQAEEAGSAGAMSEAEAARQGSGAHAGGEDQQQELGSQARAEEPWDEEAAAMGDPRRREVLAAARQRQRLMEQAARPEEMASWLVKARAQDVALFSLAAPAGTMTHAVLATALSQRHAYACAEAVRYQIRERLEELAAELGLGSEGPDGGSALRARSPYGPLVPAAPAVSGVNGGDWLSLEAGGVQVHVLTPQARHYYRLEEVFAGGPSGGGASGARGAGAGPRSRVQLFGAEAGERPLDTLETARVETAAT